MILTGYLRVTKEGLWIANTGGATQNKLNCSPAAEITG